MIAVESNAAAPDAGGGVRAIAAWAAVLAERAEVTLRFPFATTPEELARISGIELRDVGLEVHHPAPARPRSAGARAALARWRRERSYQLLVRQSTHVLRPSAARRSVLFVEFPFQQQLRRRERLYLRRWDAVVANSHFTSDWIARRWGRRSTVVPPAITPIPPRPKGPTIVAVGRFTAGARSKHQREMVDAFRELLGRGHEGWELHLCGTVESPQYLDVVRKAAAGLPVRIHPDLPRHDLEKVVAEAAIVWHATGVLDSEERVPERMEHFGIATAEAMSAGCIPVVVGKGGQREVVGPELGEWTWQSWAECVAKTDQLIAAPERHPELAARARQQSARFHFERFRERVFALVDKLLA